jgi:hypothetical protein
MSGKTEAKQHVLNDSRTKSSGERQQPPSPKAESPRQRPGWELVHGRSANWYYRQTR